MQVTFDRVVAIVGIVLAILLVVLDKAGKLKGPILFGLLALAALMTLPLALGIPWIRHTPWGISKFNKVLLAVSIVIMAYSLIAVWISPTSLPPETALGTSPTPPQPNSPDKTPKATKRPPEPESTSPPHKRAAEKPPSLANLFTTDFPGTTKATNNLTLQSSDGSELQIKRQLNMDFDAKAEFVSFYIPAPINDDHFQKTFEACMYLASQVKPTIDFFTQGHNVISSTAGQATDARDLQFSGRIYLYHEMPLTNTQRAQIVEKYRSLGYDVEFRGQDYLTPFLQEWYRKRGFPKPNSS